MPVQFTLLKNNYIVLLGILLLALLAGCTVRERTPMLFDEWGRASRIGYAERGGEIATIVQADGSKVGAVWFGRNQETDPETVTVWTQNTADQTTNQTQLDLGGTRPRQLTANSTADTIHIYWTVEKDDLRQLEHATVGWDGAIQARTTYTVDNASILRHQAIVQPNGDQIILYRDDANSLYGRYDHTDPQLLLTDIINFDLQFDSAGQGHLVFSSNDGSSQFLNYALFDGATLAISQPESGLVLYAGDDAGDDNAINGPTIMLEDDRIYVSWNRRINSPAGSFLRIFVTDFALGAPLSTASEPQQIGVPRAYPAANQPATGNYDYAELGTMLVNAPLQAIAQPNSGAFDTNQQHSEVAFASTMALVTRSGTTNVQPVVMYVRDGELQGYQTLTWTYDNSGQPSLTTDANNDLYVSWIDARRGEANPVYLISTNDQLREATQTLTRSDRGTIAYDYANRAARGMGLAFVMIPWLLVPLFWFVGGFAATSRNPYERRSHRIFGVGVIVTLIAKYFLTMDMLRFVPGVESVSVSLQLPLIIGVPIVIMGFSVLLTYLFVILRHRRRDAKHLNAVRWFLPVVGIDYVLSLMVYAIGFFE